MAPELPESRYEEEFVRAALANPNVLSEVVDIVHARDFITPRYRAIFEVIHEGWENGKPVDPPILASELERKGLLQQAGGFDTIINMSLGTPSEALYFAKQVRDQGERYRLKLLATGLGQRATAADVDPKEILEWADAELNGVVANVGNQIESVQDSIGGIVEDLLAEDTSIPFPTGFTGLDEKLSGGLRGGQMVIIAARPGVGKSTLAVDIMREGCIRHQKNALFFSLEMTKAELVTRIMSAENNVNAADFKKRLVPREKMEEMGQKLANVPGMFIDDSPNMTIQDIRAKARVLNKKHPLDLICIDYIQLLESTNEKIPRQEQVSQFSRQIKLLAKELDVPVIAVAQLNRGVEQRENPIPKASDLRESGSLEQDADIILLLNRPDTTDLDHARAGEADFIIAKHRGGPIGTVTVAHQMHKSKFADPPQF